MLLRQRGQKKNAEQTVGETLSQCIDVEVMSRPHVEKNIWVLKSFHDKHLHTMKCQIHIRQKKFQGQPLGKMKVILRREKKFQGTKEISRGFEGKSHQNNKMKKWKNKVQFCQDMERGYAFFLWKDMVEMYDRNDGSRKRMSFQKIDTLT